MDTSNASLTILIFVVAAIIIVALVIVLFLTYRNISNPRNFNDRDLPSSLPPAQAWRPEPLPQPWPQQDNDQSSPEGEPHILFGTGELPVKNRPGKIAWGDPNNSTYISQLCPLCKNALGLRKTKKCNNCGAIYHQSCWDEFGRRCVTCDKG